MGKLCRLVLGISLTLSAGVAAAPAIQSVTDSAGYGPRVAPGSLASIFGTNLASTTDQAGGFPLPTILDGTSVTIGSVSVPLTYISATQINFQVPSSLKAGANSLVVQAPGGASASFSFTVSSAAPSIYQYGVNQAVAQNADNSLNGDSAPAASGSVITVYLTGIGAVDNAVADGTATPSSPLSNATASKSATIGAASATVQFLGLTPTFAGLAQANIQVPNLPSGDYPLVIVVGGYVSASAVVSVSGTGTYTSPLQLTGSVAFTNSAASTIQLYNGVAYVCGANRIVAVNVTNPAQPTVIGGFGDNVLNGRGVRCAINTQVATPYLVEIYTASTGYDGFAVYGLGNPQSPNLVFTGVTTYFSMVSMSFSGNIAFVTTSYTNYYKNNMAIASQNGDLLVFDFTNPAGPVFLGSMVPSGQPGSGNANLKPYSEVVQQFYVYISSSTATGTSSNGTGFLDIVNISSPSTPQPINQIVVPQAAILMAFDITGNLLLVAGNTAGQRNPGVPDFAFMGNLTLTAMDITNVQAPAIISTFTTNLQVDGTFAVSAFANGVFGVINNPPATDQSGPASLMIVDARNPSNILPYPFQTQFGFNSILTTSSGYLLAPTSLGLNIYQLQI